MDPKALVDLENQSSSEENLGLWIQSDNDDDVAWFTKHNAAPRRAAHLIRTLDFLRLQRGNHLIITYINTKANLLADIIFRSYRMEGTTAVPDETVMAEFFDECKKAGYPNPVEVFVSDEEMEVIVHQQFNTTAAEHCQMMQESVLARGGTTKSTNPTGETAALASGLAETTKPLRFSGTFRFHGLGGGLRGARGLFRLEQGYDIEPDAQRSVQAWAPQMQQLA